MTSTGEIRAGSGETKLLAMISAARFSAQIAGSLALAIQTRKVSAAAVDKWIAGLEATLAELRAFRAGRA